ERFGSEEEWLDTPGERLRTDAEAMQPRGAGIARRRWGASRRRPMRRPPGRDTSPDLLDALRPDVWAACAQLGVRRVILRPPRDGDASALQVCVDRIGGVAASS